MKTVSSMSGYWGSQEDWKAWSPAGYTGFPAGYCSYSQGALGGYSNYGYGYGGYSGGGGSSGSGSGSGSFEIEAGCGGLTGPCGQGHWGGCGGYNGGWGVYGTPQAPQGFYHPGMQNYNNMNGEVPQEVPQEPLYDSGSSEAPEDVWGDDDDSDIDKDPSEDEASESGSEKRAKYTNKGAGVWIVINARRCTPEDVPKKDCWPAIAEWPCRIKHLAAPNHLEYQEVIEGEFCQNTLGSGTVGTHDKLQYLIGQGTGSETGRHIKCRIFGLDRGQACVWVPVAGGLPTMARSIEQNTNVRLHQLQGSPQVIAGLKQLADKITHIQVKLAQHPAEGGKKAKKVQRRSLCRKMTLLSAACKALLNPRHSTCRRFDYVPCEEFLALQNRQRYHLSCCELLRSGSLLPPVQLNYSVERPPYLNSGSLTNLVVRLHEDFISNHLSTSAIEAALLGKLMPKPQQKGKKKPKDCKVLLYQPPHESIYVLKSRGVLCLKYSNLGQWQSLMRQEGGGQRALGLCRGGVVTTSSWDKMKIGISPPLWQEGEQVEEEEEANNDEREEEGPLHDDQTAEADVDLQDDVFEENDYEAANQSLNGFGIA